MRTSKRFTYSKGMEMMMHATFPAVLSLCFLIQSLSAQGYADVRRLIDSSDFKGAEAVLLKRLASGAVDDSAHFYAGMLTVITRSQDRLDEGIAHLRTCVELKPNSSDYHLWLGRALGIKAQTAGIFAAMGYVGDIKSEFIRAVELDPSNYDARYDLVQFYLRAPGIAGGSVSKARDVAKDCQAYDVGMAAVLEAAVHIYKEDFQDAMNVLNGVARPSSLRIANYLRSTWLSLGFACLTEKEPEQARRVFDTCITRYPDIAYGYHGLGRSFYDLKRYDEAIPLFEKALAMNPRAGSQYRLALIYKEKGGPCACYRVCAGIPERCSQSQSTDAEGSQGADGRAGDEIARARP